ncbi:MAG: GNAT family N-acetyltransferase [Alphaproteobacteria bacterium]
MRLETRRTIIRPWVSEDLAAFGAINADPEVRHYYYPTVLSQAESDAVVDQCMQHLSDHGFGFLALEHRECHQLIGGAGLSWATDPPGGPAVEIGWILARRFWRQGFASEVSRAWFAHGWSIGLDQIVGYTSAINHPSRTVMESLGMIRDPADDFLDPTVPVDHPLAPHVLYRIFRPVGRVV